MKRKHLKIKAPRLKAVLPFVKKDAMRNMNIAYYKAYSRNMKDFLYLEMEKRRRSTKRWDHVTELLESYTSRGYFEKSRAGLTLQGIFNKNCSYVKGELPFRKTTNVLKVIASPEMLWLSYKRLKGNSGILTPAAAISKETFNNYTENQKRIFFRKKITPDGFSLRDIYLVSSLIRRNAYPWGSSRRIWLDKPGSNKKRPITIPPFLDRLVQESIKMVLIAIWEPDFESLNRSFGFRPNKSCHDAIVALQSNHTIGLTMALEGDISAAYDNIRKKDAISCLEKKIKDNKFIKFMKSRLDYDYVDKANNNSRIKPSMGIPQGGIDSPYLFNILFHELDKFVMGDLQAYLDGLNRKFGFRKASDKRPINKPRRALDARLRRLENRILELRSTAKTSPVNKQVWYTKERELKIGKRKLISMPYYAGVRNFRLFYVRYADDWILMTNASPSVIEKMKFMIKNFLSDSLGAQLSEEKSVITDTRKNAAHFLGFEIANHRFAKVVKSGDSLKRVSTFPPIFRPDRSRLINRMHVRGFCNYKGFPISVPWLTGLEATVIIERYNATIRGLMMYYTEWISRPRDLGRWIYILRYSCFKTLAHKYKSSISKIMIRFGVDRYSTATKTISAVASIKIGQISFEKGYKLETFAHSRDACLRQKRWFKLNRIFLSREAGEIGNYPLKKERPTVTHENFVDYISWVSLRARAPFDMPCAICGASGDIEMHHIRHVRKTAYRDLSQVNWLRMLSLRNRKQIPVCRHCHRYVIHGAKYQGPPLRRLVHFDDRLVDNRVIHIESFIKPGQEYFSKPLEERGWFPRGKDV